MWSPVPFWITREAGQQGSVTWLLGSVMAAEQGDKQDHVAEFAVYQAW